jgi:hypothetical protein
MVLWVLEVPVFINRIQICQSNMALLAPIAELRSVAQQIANSEFQLRMLLAILQHSFVEDI